MSTAIADLRGSSVDVRLAPTHFGRRYSFDHAKNLIIDSVQTGQEAVLESPNTANSAYHGANVGDATATTKPNEIAVLAQLFRSDWTHTRADAAPRSQLVISPGASPHITSLFGRTGLLEVTAEERRHTFVLSSTRNSRSKCTGARIVWPAEVGRWSC
ncbi:MAG: hypothetical protein M1447_04880 [Gammaproteobacteria bacterium]|nr:hypothetical protein [Gammaproteobacteria bacterium]